MVNHKCYRCLKVFDKKSNYDNHIKRKIKCENNSDKYCEKCDKFFESTEKYIEHEKKYNCFTETFNKFREIQEKINDENKKTNEKIIKRVEKLEEKLKKYKRKIDKMKEKNKKIIGDIVNNKNNIEKVSGNSNGRDDNRVTNNNIIVLDYGKNESLKHLTNEDKLDVLRSGKEYIAKMLKYVHFDDRAPANKNLKKLKDGNWKAIKKGKWEEKGKKFTRKLIFDIDDKVVDIETDVDKKLSKREKKELKKNTERMRESREKNSDSEDSYLNGIKKSINKEIDSD